MLDLETEQASQLAWRSRSGAESVPEGLDSESYTSLRLRGRPPESMSSSFPIPSDARDHSFVRLAVGFLEPPDLEDVVKGDAKPEDAESREKHVLYGSREGHQETPLYSMEMWLASGLENRPPHLAST